jgi:hypothetical protein
MPLSPARIPKDLGLQLPLKPLAINFHKKMIEA